MPNYPELHSFALEFLRIYMNHHTSDWIEFISYLQDFSFNSDGVNRQTLAKFFPERLRALLLECNLF